jgi:hypothetical protein
MGLDKITMNKIKKIKPELITLFNKLLSKHGKSSVFVCMNSWMNNIRKKDSATKLIKAKEIELEKLKRELK